MANFDFKRTSRRCSETGRAFDAGEEYISFLTEEDEELVRKDVALSEWGDPPEGCLGWWRSRVPDLEQGMVYWAPKDVLISYFQHLIEQGNDPDTTYVMAILLLQKKHIRLLDTVEQDGTEIMQLQNPTTKEKFDVPVTDVDPGRVKIIEEELAEKLFTDVAPTNDP